MESAIDILLSTSVEVAPDSFAIVSVSFDTWRRLVSEPERSPRMTAPFMVFMDKYEVTMVLDEIDLAKMRPGLEDAKIETGYRLLTFDTVMDFDVIGFIAEVSRILAAAGIPILPLSAFSRDHILIKQMNLAAALKALGPHVKELC